MVFPDSIVPLAGLFGESLDEIVSFQKYQSRIVFTYDPDRIKFISLVFLKSQSNLAKLEANAHTRSSILAFYT